MTLVASPPDEVNTGQLQAPETHSFFPILPNPVQLRLLGGNRLIKLPVTVGRLRCPLGRSDLLCGRGGCCECGGYIKRS